MKEIFCTWEELESLEEKYDLEDCGMSGRYNGYHWYQDDEREIAIYVK